MEILDGVFNFCKLVFIATFNQLISVFGIFFFFGLLLYVFARFTRITFVKSIGQKFDIYFTGWIGTPIHEIGHAIFCVFFGHKILEIKLFSPNAKDGSLGYVNHSYKTNNIWHKIGNFFIGLGPILFGSFIIFLLIKFLIPDNHLLLSMMDNQAVDLSSFKGLVQQFNILIASAKSTINFLFTEKNIQSWEFWLFLYLALCISSHMELSPPDIKGLGSGLLTIIVLLIVINSICVFFEVDVSKFVQPISSLSQKLAGVFTFSTIISAAFFGASYFLLNIYTIIRYRTAFHPFY
ncbi:MAG: hypothetical protein JEZ09_21415 [Salinivirgaceae bacterium]|nr:hypothetical protein [Salinivirgaceae bacterium]